MKQAFSSRRLRAALALGVVLGGGGALAALVAGGPLFAAEPVVTMYKDPDCGCCDKWAAHMRAHGFTVKEVDSLNMGAVKREAGVPFALASCHTALVGGYVVEGHVPASDIRRLLAEKPAVTGIAAAGMPLGSPGMEGPYPAQRYDVLSFDRAGRSAVYSSH